MNVLYRVIQTKLLQEPVLAQWPLVVDKPTCSSCAGVNWVMYVKWQLSTWNKDSPVRTNVRWDLKFCLFFVVDRIHFRYIPTSLCVQSRIGSLLRVSISSSFRNKFKGWLLSTSIININICQYKVFGRHLHQSEWHQSSPNNITESLQVQVIIRLGSNKKEYFLSHN